MWVCGEGRARMHVGVWRGVGLAASGGAGLAACGGVERGWPSFMEVWWGAGVAT